MSKMDMEQVMSVREVSKEFGVPLRTVAGWCSGSEDGTIKKNPLPWWGYRKTDNGKGHWLLHYNAVVMLTGKDPRKEYLASTKSVRCPQCLGTGTVWVDSGDSYRPAEPIKCDLCKSSGYTSEAKAAEWIGEEITL